MSSAAVPIEWSSHLPVPGPEVYGICAFVPPLTGGVPRTHQPFVTPVRPHQQLEIHQEDCVFDGILTVQSYPSKAAMPPGRLPDLLPKRSTKLRGNTVGGAEVFVQNARRPSDFTPVAPGRARRLYGIDGGRTGATEVNGGGSGNASGSGSAAKQRQIASNVCSVAAIDVAALDADAAQLIMSFDSSDQNIFELLGIGEDWRLRSTVLFFVGQGLLLGLSLIAGAAAITLPEARLKEALQLLEPGLTGFTIAFSETALIGCLLQMMDRRERSNVALVGEPAPSADPETERDHPNTARFQLVPGVVSALANAVVLLCCLFSPGDGKAYGAAVGPWSASSKEGDARTLLMVRACFGIIAMGPAIVELRLLVSPKLPVGILTPMLGMTLGTLPLEAFHGTQCPPVARSK